MKMVQMMMKIASETEGPAEWAMIEMQGDLENRDGSHLAGKFIGDLRYSKKDAPIMIVGHHILHGKVMKLDKPFAVLHKIRHRGESEMETDDESKSIEYNVTALITQKIIFKNRPKPIIANVPKKV